MAKVLITGVRKVDFTDDRERQVQGTSLYYRQKLEPRDGLHAAGYSTEKVWLKGGTPLEAKMLSADYTKAFEADMQFDIMPGSKRPVLVDIIY